VPRTLLDSKQGSDADLLRALLDRLIAAFMVATYYGRGVLFSS
jgi:hypothetical protein